MLAAVFSTVLLQVAPPEVCQAFEPFGLGPLLQLLGIC
jgi:hypothetical protein